MWFFLLQGSSPLEARQNPLYLQVFFGMLLLIIPIILIGKITAHIAAKREKNQKNNPSASTASPRQIKRATSDYGFSRQQLRFFEQICKKYHIRNPEFLLKNEMAADRLFKTIYHTLENSAEDGDQKSAINAENAKMLLFSIRQQIETRRRLSRGITSTKSIGKNQALTISGKRLDNSPSSVLENTPEGLIISIPRDEYGNEIRLPILSRIHVYFQLSTGLSYSFTSFLLRYINKASSSAIVLNHNKKLLPMHSRIFKRMELEKSCLFSGVKITKKGHGASVQTVYTPLSDRYRATLVDISGGGCCLRANHPVSQGNMVNIELPLQRKMDPVIGRVVRINRVQDGKGYFLHVQFVRMKKYVRNMIYSYIYDYS